MCPRHARHNKRTNYVSINTQGTHSNMSPCYYIALNASKESGLEVIRSNPHPTRRPQGNASGDFAGKNRNPTRSIKRAITLVCPTRPNPADSTRRHNIKQRYNIYVSVSRTRRRSASLSPGNGAPRTVQSPQPSITIYGYGYGLHDVFPALTVPVPSNQPWLCRTQHQSKCYEIPFGRHHIA